ncbi:MAG: hypothetical protein M5T61_06740 [Acidimicrobiia bacterium]|nr:hypothetical protein [Acidimicrobiia bacterium]
MISLQEACDGATLYQIGVHPLDGVTECAWLFDHRISPLALSECRYAVPQRRW